MWVAVERFRSSMKFDWMASIFFAIFRKGIKKLLQKMQLFYQSLNFG
jgi:hypothetical protein